MSGAGYSGIEKLKKAEEEAAAIEQEAKQSRLESWWLRVNLTVRLVRMSAMSEARVKAKEEIDSYRAELEAAFQQKKEAVFVWEKSTDYIGYRCRIEEGSRGT